MTPKSLAPVTGAVNDRHVPTLDLARATLRVVGDDLEPRELTELLGVKPSTSYSKGDVLTSKRGTTRVAPTGYWSLDAEDSAPADLDAQVTRLLARLPDEAALWNRLHAHFEIDLFCGWFMKEWNEGTALNATTLNALANRGIDLTIDLWDGRDD